MGRRKRAVWVVMHYEYMDLPDDPRVDSVQFHVSSTLEKAEEYVNQVGVEPYSWWQVHPYLVDDIGDAWYEVHYFSHRGTRLKSPHFKRAKTAYLKHAARRPEWFPPQSAKPG